MLAEYHFALRYAQDDGDPRPLPRIQIAIEFFSGQLQPVSLNPILDSGAEISTFDGTAIQFSGWNMSRVIAEALDVKPIRGLGNGRPIPGYLHVVTCYVGTPARFAEIPLHVLITPPDTLRYSVIGRRSFFEQVDITFAESDKMIYLRLRNPEVITAYEY